MLNRVPYTFFALALALPGVSMACGFELMTPEMVAENRAKEVQLTKLTAKQSEFVFVGELTNEGARSEASEGRDVSFKVVESLLGKPESTFLAHLEALGSIPLSCDESAWFNMPHRIAEGGTYIVYVAPDGRLLRAAAIDGRSEIHLPADEEKTILIKSGKQQKPTKPECIVGSATMLTDGTIELQLRAEGDSGLAGDAALRYPPDHPQYESMLRHIDGLQRGESTLVPCWPPE